MTQEQAKFIDEFIYLASKNTDRARSLAEGFFASNVCIPKGENRHPDADVLHEAIEGTNIQEKQCNKWCDTLIQDGINWLSEYRIKPIYEWQWYDVEHVLDFYISTKRVRMLNSGQYMTDDEADSCSCYGLIYRFEETKRERKR